MTLVEELRDLSEEHDDLFARAADEITRLQSGWDTLEANHWALNWEPGFGWEVSSFAANEWIVNKMPAPLAAVLAAKEETKP